MHLYEANKNEMERITFPEIIPLWNIILTVGKKVSLFLVLTFANCSFSPKKKGDAAMENPKASLIAEQIS